MATPLSKTRMNNNVVRLFTDGENSSVFNAKSIGNGGGIKKGGNPGMMGPSQQGRKGLALTDASNSLKISSSRKHPSTTGNLFKKGGGTTGIELPPKKSVKPLANIQLHSTIPAASAVGNTNPKVKEMEAFYTCDDELDPEFLRDTGAFLYDVDDFYIPHAFEEEAQEGRRWVVEEDEIGREEQEDDDRPDEYFPEVEKFPFTSWGGGLDGEDDGWKMDDMRINYIPDYPSVPEHPAFLDSDLENENTMEFLKGLFPIEDVDVDN